MTFNESPLLCAPLTLGKIGRISNGLTTNHFPTQLPRISSLTEHPTSSREPMPLLLIPEYWVSVPCNTQSHLNKTVTFSFGTEELLPTLLTLTTWPASHRLCWFTLIPSATPVWPCMECEVFPRL